MSNSTKKKNPFRKKELFFFFKSLSINMSLIFFSIVKNIIQSANLPTEINKYMKGQSKSGEKRKQQKSSVQLTNMLMKTFGLHLIEQQYQQPSALTQYKTSLYTSCSFLPSSLPPCPSRLTCILLTFCSETLKTLFGDYCEFQAIIPLLQNVR